MSYTITQNLEKYPENENAWTDLITSDNEPGYFIAVTSNILPEGSDTREMTVQMIALPQAPEENETNSGLYVRGEGEKQVKATLLNQNGDEVASNTTAYPS